MAQVATYPEDNWQHVVCRLCTHPFDVLVIDQADGPVSLCQTCTILVDWLGQPAETTPAPGLPRAVQVDEPRKRAGRVKKKAPEQPHLADLLDRWGALWRSDQEQE